MDRHYNIYQINCFLHDAKVFYISVGSMIEPLRIHMYYDHKLMFGISDQSPLYPYLCHNPVVSLLAYREDHHYFSYHGTLVFDEEEYSILAKKRSPRLCRYFNEATHFQLKMFHLEKAEAYIYDAFHNSIKAEID
ncbi:MAG: hypothetical protein ACI32Q_11610 [Intestinibaculum porci]|uniref:hypothetical protein n=1 Tax=Intestinibaculum porci TaxID=2487118 RepID=UPI003F01D3A0